MSLHRLLPLYERARASLEPLVLCTVIRTGGSTYAKPGALMLIAADGEYAGLLSGGCLEGDLREHARGVATTGTARIVSYDLRSSTDQLFGLGAGCEGAMDVLLTRVDAQSHWQPLEYLVEGSRRGEPRRVGFVTASAAESIPVGFSFTPENEAFLLREAAAAAPDNSLIQVSNPDVELFIAAVLPPPRLLLAGGGPDARPVATLAAFLGWRVTVADHRAAYLQPTRFPAGVELLETRAEDIERRLRLEDFSAAVVMSHQLEADLQYLRALARSEVAYVGLLGPAARREKLMNDLGIEAQGLRSRLRAPVGLDIGGRSPESIALSIIGEVHAVLAGRGGRPFSDVADAHSHAR
jgi:xanthine dehydrogenase accessory factor